MNYKKNEIEKHFDLATELTMDLQIKIIDLYEFLIKVNRINEKTIGIYRHLKKTPKLPMFDDAA